MRPVVGLVAIAVIGCEGFAAVPQAAVPAVGGGPTVSFRIPDGWSLLDGTAAVHYLTSGDPGVCENVVGGCDPSTYVMESGSIDAWIAEADAEQPCAETARPTWDARVEARPNPMRDATYRLEWTVCYPESPGSVVIIGEMRTGDLELRERMLDDLRAFVESVTLVDPSGPAK